jgi:threonine/homoserine/homoserine lactone efflux protein
MVSSKKTSILIHGFLTGLTLQLAIGPVFFYLLNLSIQNSVIHGLAAVAGVTLADAMYILLAVAGIGATLEKPSLKKWTGRFSALFLGVFGAFMIGRALISGNISADSSQAFTVASAFGASFLLTASSPLTMVFFTSLFAAKALESGYNRSEMWLFGAATLAATPVFLSTTVSIASLLQNAIPVAVLTGLNVVVGTVLLLYGAVRLVSTFRNNPRL